jgi:hypothetical protein
VTFSPSARASAIHASASSMSFVAMPKYPPERQPMRIGSTSLSGCANNLCDGAKRGL